MNLHYQSSFSDKIDHERENLNTQSIINIKLTWVRTMIIEYFKEKQRN